MFCSLDNTTFKQFLGTSFDANALRNEEILQPSNIPQLPRQGLDVIIANTWNEIMSYFEPDPLYALANIRKPLLFVHSSPGCGKVCTISMNKLFILSFIIFFSYVIFYRLTSFGKCLASYLAIVRALSNLIQTEWNLLVFLSTRQLPLLKMIFI